MTISKWYDGKIDVERAVLEALDFVRLNKIYVDDPVYGGDPREPMPAWLDALDNDLNRILSGEQLEMEDFTGIVRLARNNINNDCADTLAEAFFQKEVRAN